MRYSLNVNDTQFDIDAAPDTPLLWALRDGTRLTGTKFGCGIAQCGACTVYLDGQPTRSCAIPVRLVKDRDITTIEGLQGAEADAIVAAWRAIDVPQCGYCQSGQILSAVALLRETPRPTDGDIDRAMAGNVCRCATYHRIRAAIHDAATRLEDDDVAG